MTGIALMEPGTPVAAQPPPPAAVPPPPAAPPVPPELERVLKRMRFPYLRKAAPNVLATARSQRWDPAGLTPLRARIPQRGPLAAHLVRVACEGHG
ncbi:hypothetical protein ABZY03_33890, partial [Streptomyces klenkii]